jgi:hypothetical protein
MKRMAHWYIVFIQEIWLVADCIRLQNAITEFCKMVLGMLFFNKLDYQEELAWSLRIKKIKRRIATSFQYIKVSNIYFMKRIDKEAKWGQKN